MAPFRLALLLAIALGAGAAAPALARGQAPSPEAQLAHAKSQFDAFDYEGAAATLDQLIAQVEPVAAKDAALARVLPPAYEMRARSRFGLNNVQGAEADFRALIRAAPGYALTGQVSPRVSRLFDDIRKAIVGSILLNLTPADADLELDGAPFTPTAGAIPILAGTHTLSGRRSGCRSASQSFTVVPDATVEVVLTLERVSASVALVTSPVGVDVVVDGVSRGRTEAGPLPPQWTEAVAKLGVPAGAVSKPLVLDDLSQGAHTVEYQRDCHRTVAQRIVIDRPADFQLDPVKLEKAIASIFVDSRAAGVSVLLDGEPRGQVPLALDEVCEGSHVVELRSPWGRYVERLDLRAGDKVTVQGAVRPAVGLLSVTGLPEGYRGTDLRLAVERALAPTKGPGLFALPADKVQQALRAESLSPGWLAFDRSRRPIGAAASAMTPAARLEIGGRLSKSLDAQAVAELTARPGGDRNQFLLAVLAAGSSEPDVIELALDDPASVGAAIARFDYVPAVFRPSAGMAVADVLDVTGAVVIGVDPGGTAARAGLAPGDVITSAGAQPIADGSGFTAVVAQRTAGGPLAFEARGANGVPKRGELTIAMAPRLIAMTDQSLLFNAIVLSLRAALAQSAGGGAAEPIVRLNLAVALMRLGNWLEARAELSKVSLAAGPGVSNGTVQYLLGLCHEALGQPAEAEQAWRAAASDAESLLTEDGPPVRELAAARLAGRAKK
jgi:hypothetical protein